MKQHIFNFIFTFIFTINSGSSASDDVPEFLKLIPENYNSLTTLDFEKLKKSQYLIEIQNSLMNFISAQLAEKRRLIEIAKVVGFKKENLKKLHLAALSSDIPEDKLEGFDNSFYSDHYSSFDNSFYSDHYSSFEKSIIFLEFGSSISLEVIIDIIMNVEHKADKYVVKMIEGKVYFGDIEGKTVAYQASETCIAILETEVLKDIRNAKKNTLYDNPDVQDFYKQSSEAAISLISISKPPVNSVKTISGHIRLSKQEHQADIKVHLTTEKEAKTLLSQVQLYASVFKEDKVLKSYLDRFFYQIENKNIHLKLKFTDKDLRSIIKVKPNNSEIYIEFMELNVSTDLKSEKIQSGTKLKE